MRCLYLLILSICLNICVVFGQQIEIKQLSDIPQNQVLYLHEDHLGFMWIATLDGLYRYNGVDYQIYRHEDKSLASNLISIIDEDSAGNIWVGLFKYGISRIDRATGVITNYKFEDLLPNEELSTSNKIMMAIDAHDNIWIGLGAKLIKIELSEENHDIKSVISRTIDDNRYNRTQYIHRIKKLQNGDLYILTDNMIGRISNDSNTLDFKYTDFAALDICEYEGDLLAVNYKRTYHIALDSESGKYKKIEQVLPTGATNIIYYDNSIWFGNTEGVWLFQKDSNKDKWELKRQLDCYNAPFELLFDDVSCFELTQSGQLWVGLEGNGIMTIGKKEREFYNYPSYYSEENSLPTNIIRAIFEDAQGNIWLGTETDGVYKLEHGNGFESTYNKVDISSINKSEYISPYRLKFDINALSGIKAFEQTGGDGINRNVIWIGKTLSKKLISLDAETHEGIKQSDSKSINTKIIDLQKSDNNTLWAATSRAGLWRLKIDNSGHIIENRQFPTDPDDEYSTSSVNIRSIYKDHRGDLWISTSLGVNHIDKDDLNSDKPRFRRGLDGVSKLDLSKYYILQIAEHGDNMLFASLSDGLIIYDRKEDSLSFVSTNEGLANNSLKCVIPDKNSENIWMTTNVGISCYNTETKNIVNYDKTDGLENLKFTEIGGVQLADGRILLGNYRGIISFYSENIHPSTRNTKMYFTDLYVDHQKIDIGGDILENKLSHTHQLELKYNDHNFSIGFAGINTSTPTHDKYIYKLEGVDNNWNECNQKEMIAHYTNIHEGRYTFRVKCVNSDNIWSDDELKLIIRVRPPYYRSTVAYALYFMLFLLIIYITYRIIRLIYIKKREAYEAQLKHQRTEELMNYKMESFVNLSHEFRTPLTLMKIPLESVIMKNRDHILTKDLKEIDYNINSMMSLINELLDFEKIESGKKTIDVVCVEANSFIELYFNKFTRVAESQNLTYQFTKSDSPQYINIDKRLFEKVVLNTISNAFKYSPKESEIEVAIISKIESVLIVIKNSGVTIPNEDLPHLFDRYYQGARRQKVNSSGIGLAFSKSIVELHNGVIHIENIQNWGVKCVIELPISRDKVTDIATDTSDDIDLEKLQEMVESSQPVISDVSWQKSNNHKDKATVLVIDDNERIRYQLCDKLQEEYNILLAENGLQGFEMCRRHYPDLVITDINMPIMDGIEMCRKIKSCEEVSHTPILVMSIDATVKSQIDSFSIGGAEGYIEKPFNIEILKENIKTILGNREIVLRKFNKESIISPADIARTPADQKFLTQIIAIIKKNMSDSDLNLEYIANEYGVTRTYLNIKIKALTGETSREFLRNIRLKYAAKLVLQRNHSISEISLKVGYKSADVFRNRFKEHFGVLPSDYTPSHATSKDDELA